MRRLVAWIARIALLSGIGVVLGATWFSTPALAHAALDESDPASGEILQTPPEEIRLTFTEPPDVSLTTIGVEAGGVTLPTGPPEQVPGSDRELRLRLPELDDGVYTVTWRTVSETDGHVTAGAFTFGVGVTRGEVSGVVPRDETPPPSPLAVTGKWGLYVGLAVLFGAAVAGLVVFGPATVAGPALLAVAWIAAAVGVVVITLEERAVLSVPLGTLLSSEAGGDFVSLAIAVGVAGLATLVAAVRTSRATLALLAAATAAAMFVRALTGHAGGSATAVGEQWLHLMAVGTWIGGLAWLVVSLQRGVESMKVRRFSNLAAVGLTVLFVSGFLRAANELGGLAWWLDPFENDYSTALVVKLGVVVPLVGLGALNRFRNVARIERAGSRPLLRTVGAELGLAATVFAVTGVMTGLPPQEGSDHARAERPLVVTGSDFATTTRVRLQISPGEVGPNEFVADVTDFDTGEPVDAQRVSLRFDLPARPEVASELDLEPMEDGTWHAESTTLAMPGTWNVTVLVEGAGDSTTVELRVTPRVPDQRVEVSRVPGQPDLYTIFLGGDVQIQGYVDPGTPGRTNQVHVTAFEGTDELPLRSAVIGVTTPADERFEPDLLRLGRGHFAANIELTPGDWSFDVTAEARDGSVLSAAFEQRFET
jgi:copper transport protein